MQHKQTPKTGKKAPKNKAVSTSQSANSNKARETGRRGKRDFKANVVASLRIGHMNNTDDCSVIYQAAASAASYAAAYIRPSTTQPNKAAPLNRPDVEADSDAINLALKEYQDQINLLRVAAKAIKEKVAENKTAGKETDEAIIKQHSDLLEQIDLLQLKRVELVAENIREHATRRVDLMFHLMIAIYNTNLVIAKARTTKQHGSGSEETDTAACHDSLFPNIKTTKPADNSVMGAVKSYWPLTLFQSVPVTTADESILQNTHFLETMNECVELPTTVNQFDCHMEMRGSERSSLVKISVGILNRVSKGEIDPIQGMSEFCPWLQRFFEQMEFNYVKPPADYTPEGKDRTPKTTAKILQYQKEGAYRIMDSYRLRLQSRYINMILRTKNFTWGESVTSLFYSGHYRQRMLEIQKEILSNKINVPAKPDASTILTFGK